MQNFNCVGKMKISNLKLVLFFVLALTGMYVNNVLADTPQLTYSNLNPHPYFGTLIIQNNGNIPATISQINCSSSGPVYCLSENELGKNVVQTSRPDLNGINTDTTFYINPAYTIQPHQSGELDYSVDFSLTTPLYGVAMNPTQITVVFQGSSVPVPIKIAGACSGSVCLDPGKGKDIMGYYLSSYENSYNNISASKLSYNKINGVTFGFLIFNQDGRIEIPIVDSSFDLSQIQEARQRYPYLNASLSFGGRAWINEPFFPTPACKHDPSVCFRAMASDSMGSKTFAKNAVAAMKEVHFNGINIAWEYPKSKDAENYIALLQNLRTALSAREKLDGKHYYLSISAPVHVDQINQLTPSQWQAVATLVDKIDLASDFYNKTNSLTDFISAMNLDPQDPTAKDPVSGKYDVTDAVNIYKSEGVPVSKLVLGIPTYGRLYGIEGTGKTEGLYQNIAPSESICNPTAEGFDLIYYNCIVDPSMCGYTFTRPSLTLVDPTNDSLGKYAKTPWGYSPNWFVPYDDQNSAAYKARWVEQQGLAGIMLSNLGGDLASDDKRSIVNAIQQVFNPSK